MIRDYGPRPEFDPPGGLSLSLIGPFDATGQEIFKAYADAAAVASDQAQAAGSTAASAQQRAGGHACIALDSQAQSVLDQLLQTQGLIRSSEPEARPGFVGLVLVASEPGLAYDLALKCAPGEGECCLFVDTSAGPGQECCEVVMGSRLLQALGSLMDDPGRSTQDPGVGAWLSRLLDGNVKGLADTLRQEGRLAGLSLPLLLPFMGLGSAVYEILQRVSQIVARLPLESEGLPGLSRITDVLQAPLDQWMPTLLAKATQDRYAQDDGTGDRSEILDFQTGMFKLSLYASDAVAPLLDLLRPVYKLLPDARWAFELLIDELQLNYSQSRCMEQVQASLLFQKAVLTSVLSMKGISGALRDNAQAAEKHQQQLQDLAMAGAVVGGTSFLAGTIYGVLYDIVDTFVQLIHYSFAGIRWVFLQELAVLQEAWNWVSGSAPRKDDHPAATDATIAAWFPAFDLQQFFDTDWPQLYERLKSLCYAIRDDFILNAEKYGSMVGEYLWTGLGQSLETTLALVFDPYPEDAGYLERIWYVIKQWFYLGSVLGPLIIDIILAFCTVGSSGVLSAVTKLGKLDKLKDVFRINKVGTEVVQGLKLYSHIAALVPDQLDEIMRLVSRIIEKVWDAIGPLADQFLTKLADLKKLMPDVDLEWWARTIDGFYESASNLNFLVGLFMLMTGGSDINQDGQILEAAA